MSKKERGAAQSADKKPLTTSRKELDSDLVIFKKVNVKEKKKQIISSGVLLLVCFGSLAYLFFFSGWQGVPGFASARDRTWREPNWVVVDIAPGEMDALAREFGVPIRYVGLGERAEDLRVFDPRAFVDGLLPGSA